MQRSRVAISVVVLSILLAVSCDRSAPPTGAGSGDDPLFQQQVTPLPPNADTYIRKNAANQNFGRDTILRLQSTGKHRVLVRWDPQAITQAIGANTLVSARLELTIVRNPDDWGAVGRSIAAHRMKVAWTELGATWNCSDDIFPSNNKADCVGGNAWTMDDSVVFAGGTAGGGQGAPGADTLLPWIFTPTDTQVIANGRRGVVAFNVTADVAGIPTGGGARFGWLVKKVNEKLSGTVDFGSRENSRPPRLVLTLEPVDTTRPPVPPLPNLPGDTLTTVERPGIPRDEVLYYRNIVGVIFDDTTSGRTIRSMMARYNATVLGGAPGDVEYFFQIPDPGTAFADVDGTVARLDAEQGVRLARMVYRRWVPIVDGRYPNDGQGSQRADWANPTTATRPLVRIRAPLAWGCETGAYTTARIPVAVLDFTFDQQHRDLVATHAVPDLAPLGLGPSKYFTMPAIRNHGTAVAGILAARTDNGRDIAGMLWNTNPILYHLSDGISSVPDPAGYLTLAIDHAISEHVRVLSTSFHFGEPVEADVERIRIAFQRYLDAGGLLVMSTGQDEHTPRQNGLRLTIAQLAQSQARFGATRPAAARLYQTGYANQIIFVAGTDAAGAFWGPSNYWSGATVVAPATPIVTLQTTADGSIGTVEGTSFSQPFVAGVAGLLLSLDPALSAGEVKGYILRGRRQPRVNPQTGVIEPPPAVANAPEADVYQLDAYGALTLLASEHSGIPLCGNRVWTTDQELVAERDTQAHTVEVLASLGQRANLLNARHGGRRIELFGFTADVNLAFTNGTWTPTTDPPTTQDGAVYLSAQQASHDLDSGVVFNSSGDGVFNISIRDLHTGVTTPFKTLTETLAGNTTRFCLRLSSPDQTGQRQCVFETSSGSAEHASLTLAYSPLGDEIVAAISRRNQQFVSASGFQPCPDAAPGDPNAPLCQDASFRDDPVVATVHILRIATAQEVAQWSIPSKGVFWLGVSEDGAQASLGEGTIVQTNTLHWTQFGNLQNIADPPQMTACGIGYREYRRGPPLRPLLAFGPNTCQDLLKGGLSPSPKSSVGGPHR